jgi:hypothetical protein
MTDALVFSLTGAEAEGSDIPAAVPVENLTPETQEAARGAPEAMEVETNRISTNGNPTLCTSVIVPGRGYHVQSLSQVVQIHTTRV